MPFLCEYVDQCKQSPPPTPKETNMPIGCIIMYHTNTGFTPDNGGTNGYFLNFGAECWKLCDGTTGSDSKTGLDFGAVPDLVNKFARGINTTSSPQSLPENININVAPIMLSSDQLPEHTHPQNSVAVDGTVGPPTNDCNHDHSNFGGTWGFTYWIPDGGSGTNPGGGVGHELINSLQDSPAPVYPGPIGNRTGGVSSSGSGNLAKHTHSFTGSTKSGNTGPTGSGKSITPTANGSSIKPASQDVLFIIRVV